MQGCNKLHKKVKMVARDQQRDWCGVWVKRLYQSLIVMNEPSVTKKTVNLLFELLSPVGMSCE